MFWAIEFFPSCTHHVFLSHCAEDRPALVLPLYEALLRRNIFTWLDRHDYPYGRGSRVALRDSILQCRHSVFLITDAMLASSRGWCVQELAWAELLQDNLVRSGGVLLNVILPLFFTDMADSRLPRSVWQVVKDKGPFCPPGAMRVVWAADHIEKFLRREERLVTEIRPYARRKEVRTELRKKTGLFDRVTRFDPQPLPP